MSGGDDVKARPYVAGNEVAFTSFASNRMPHLDLADRPVIPTTGSPLNFARRQQRDEGRTLNSAQMTAVPFDVNT